MTNRRAGRWRPWTTLLTLLLLGTAATGCGNLTPGGFTGEATVTVSGDVDPLPAAAGSTSGPAPSSPALSSHDDEPEGEVEVEFMLFLIADNGSALRLGEEEIRVRVDVQGRNEVEAVREQVPIGRYTELQVVFTEIKAEIDAGLIINGVPVVGEVRVEIEDLTLLVVRPIDMEVTGGDVVEMLVDLNTPTWLQAVDPTTGQVNEAFVQDIIDVTVR